MRVVREERVQVLAEAVFRRLEAAGEGRAVALQGPEQGKRAADLDKGRGR